MQLEGSKLIGRTQVFNSVFSNTGQPCPTQPCFGGTSPEAGVDIEPNVPTDQTKGIYFKNCTIAGTRGP